MKRAIYVFFIILSLSLFFPLIKYRIFVKATPFTWIVDWSGSGHFRTIQEVFINGSVVDGDIIFVRKGTYSGNIIVNKSVSLVGEDAASTIIKGDETGSVITIVLVDNVSITNFTIRESGNTVVDSAIYVEGSSGIRINCNNIINNNNGIFLLTSIKNSICGNTIVGNKNGISFFLSSGNVISGNTITNSALYGIQLFSSTNNTIYHNNFQNVAQVRSDSVNIWTHCGEGNYWKDYNGTDFYSGPFQNETGCDGIGDEPYIIDGNNQDSRPLMGMFSSFNVNLKTESFNVDVICNSTISDVSFKIGEETGNKIILFSVVGESDAISFCRLMIPTKLMDYPLILLVDEQEVVPTLLSVSNATHSYIYFTYTDGEHSIIVISSKTLTLYNELFGLYNMLQIDFYNLNTTYYSILNDYKTLLDVFAQLQNSYQELSVSYQEHLLKYSESAQNFRNLIYVFAITVAVFIIVTVYLSKRAHVTIKTGTKALEERE